MRKTIAVMGGTGAQGGGVARALLDGGGWCVRVLTRNPESSRSRALADLGCELRQADMNDPVTLEAAFEEAYGVFAVTNHWDRQTRTQEYSQGEAAVEAALAAGVSHFIWSTLPDYHAISGGRFTVPHFTSKSQVDPIVKQAGFPYWTFVEAPFYYQNFHTVFAPQENKRGQKQWHLSLDRERCRFHCADIAELGLLVAAALEAPDLVGHGAYLPLSGGNYSWNDLVEILNSQGHEIAYQQISQTEYDAMFTSAREFRHMMEFWQEYDYFGPGSEEKIALSNKLVPRGFTAFGDWARVNLPTGARSKACGFIQK